MALIRFVVAMPLLQAHAGCETQLNQLCTDWKLSENDCVACYESNKDELSDSCTDAQIQEKCAITWGVNCEALMSTYCPLWKVSEVDSCKACVDTYIGDLRPNCSSRAVAYEKCLKHPAMPPEVPSPSLQPMEGAPQPHVLMFLIDDQGWSNVGYRNSNAITPNMDAFSRAGVILDRHYTYRFCGPSRAAFMTGREPHHVKERTNYVTRGMTMLPRKLQQVGYVTHMVGKWHLGSSMDWMTPFGRGFNTSFGFLGAEKDHYTHENGELGCEGADLWETDHPAIGMIDGRYSEYQHDERLQSIINEHDTSRPLFLYASLQIMHAPQEVPDKYSDMYTYPGYSDDFKITNGMATLADDIFGNVRGALESRGMWDNTLVILSSDNGGSVGKAVSGSSANNYPLRGGKQTDFEGGVRVVSALGGGFLPSATRGTTLDGYMHAADWYPTICVLAGVDPSDSNPADTSVPNIDGFDLWPYITGSETNSPRSEIVLAAQSGDGTGAIISGDFKLIVGRQRYGFWQAEIFPNTSTNHNTEKAFDCGDGCLFDVRSDPEEHTDLARSMPDKLAEMQQLLQSRASTLYNPTRIADSKELCEAYRSQHEGIKGPYYSFESNTAAFGKMVV